LEITKIITIFAKTMDKLIFLTIFSIIFMMLCIQNNLSLLSEGPMVGKRFDMRIQINTQGVSKRETPLPVLSYLPKSQHLTCQHTRAGTLDESYTKCLVRHLASEHFFDGRDSMPFRKHPKLFTARYY